MQTNQHQNEKGYIQMQTDFKITKYYELYIYKFEHISRKRFFFFFEKLDNHSNIYIEK